MKKILSIAFIMLLATTTTYSATPQQSLITINYDVLTQSVNATFGTQVRSIIIMSTGGAITTLGMAGMVLNQKPQDEKTHTNIIVVLVGTIGLLWGYLENRGVIDSCINYFRSHSTP